MGEFGSCLGSPVPGVWARSGVTDGGDELVCLLEWKNLSLLRKSGLDLLRNELDTKMLGMCLHV